MNSSRSKLRKTGSKKTKKSKNEVLSDDNSVEDDIEASSLSIDTPNVTTFENLGILEVLCEACTRLGWKAPTAIQIKAIPLALENKDVIGLAETGSGKTGAFALPILQNLILSPQKLFALVLTPTRELAYQIKEQFEALVQIVRKMMDAVASRTFGLFLSRDWTGPFFESVQNCTSLITGYPAVPNISGLSCLALNMMLNKSYGEQTCDNIYKGKAIGVKCSVIVGGMDIKAQMEELRERPHIIVGTPGRLLDHLKKTKGFNLRDLKYLVMDEADRILNMDFEEEVNAILHELPTNIRTLLFSATMTSKVNKLQRVHLRDPIRVEANSKYQTVTKLDQYMLFVPYDYKVVYLVYLLNEIGDQSVIIFCMTRTFTLRTTLILRALGYNALPLFGKMDQNKRLGVLNRFKSKEKSILLATDVASRGLDIPNVDYVINYDCPQNAKDYIHRVGRTARAGKGGCAITLVDQYTVFNYSRVELYLKAKLPVYPAVEEEVMVFKDTVLESTKIAEKELMQLDYKGEKRRKTWTDKSTGGNKSDNKKKKSKKFNK